MSHPEYENVGGREDRLIEECAELIQILIKARRFGWGGSHPDTPHLTNREMVEFEINDVEVAIINFRKAFPL